MRTCDEILDLLSAALDGQLTAGEQAALDAHLAHCPACSTLYDDLRILHEETVCLDDIPTPAGFAAAVMDAIAADPAQNRPDNVTTISKKRKPHSVWKKWSACAAAVAVAVLGAVSLPGLLGGGTYKSANTMNDNSSSIMEAADCTIPDSETSISYGARSESAAGATSALSDKSITDQDSFQDGGQLDNFAILGTQQATSDDQSQSYCGLLTIDGTDVPAGLEKYESLSDGGELCYVLPAEEFYALAGDLDLTPEELEPNAQFGLVIVKES